MLVTLSGHKWLIMALKSIVLTGSDVFAFSHIEISVSQAVDNFCVVSFVSGICVKKRQNKTHTDRFLKKKYHENILEINVCGICVG